MNFNAHAKYIIRGLVIVTLITFSAMLPAKYVRAEDIQIDTEGMGTSTTTLTPATTPIPATSETSETASGIETENKQILTTTSAIKDLNVDATKGESQYKFALKSFESKFHD